MVVVWCSFSSCYKLITYSLFCVRSLVLSVGSSYFALQCSQVQINHYYAGLWPGHHLCPQLSATSSRTQVSGSLCHWFPCFSPWFKFFNARDAFIYLFLNTLFAGGIFTSPRLSKLPGWNSKDGTLNLEKVCIWHLKFYAFCGNRS